MKLKYINNSILETHFLNYEETLQTHNKLVSTNLTDLEIKNLYNKKYKLNEFDIYKYITALDYIADALRCSKYSLTEGIKSDKNRYNNILIDLFYRNISSGVIMQYPISVVFGIKQIKYGEIRDLTRSEKLNNLFLSYYEVDDGYSMNY